MLFDEDRYHRITRSFMDALRAINLRTGGLVIWPDIPDYLLKWQIEDNLNEEISYDNNE